MCVCMYVCVYAYMCLYVCITYGGGIVQGGTAVLPVKF